MYRHYQAMTLRGLVDNQKLRRQGQCTVAPKESPWRLSLAMRTSQNAEGKPTSSQLLTPSSSTLFSTHSSISL
jgi:hypothetical protein